MTSEESNTFSSQAKKYQKRVKARKEIVSKDIDKISMRNFSDLSHSRNNTQETRPLPKNRSLNPSTLRTIGKGILLLAYL